MTEKYLDDIDLISREIGHGEISTAAANSFWGINHRGVGNPMQLNQDNHGLVLFTRPCLNLSYDNVAMLRQLTPLLTPEEWSQHRMIRALLDRVGQVGGWGRNGTVSSPAVDPLQAFLTPITNHLMSCTGWPDQEFDTFTSKEGVHREVYSLADGVPKDFTAFDLTTTFRNVTGDPITLLFFVWMQYITAVTIGEMVPYPAMVIEKEIDYQSRCYRLILDPTRTYVQRIASTIVYPTANPLGQVFNFNADHAMSQEAKELNVRWRAVGVEYYDPILIFEFNKVVTTFNPYMEDDRRASTYVKLAKNEVQFFNYRGYPRIDPKSSALEWWVTPQQYREIQRKMAQ